MNGKPIQTFGTGGQIELRENLGRYLETQGVRLTSPGVIYKDLMIVGGRVGEALPTSPGDILGYDVRSGKLRWSFHTIPHPGEFGDDTWPESVLESGAANNWAGMALDERRAISGTRLTGSAATDFYGADWLRRRPLCQFAHCAGCSHGQACIQFVRHDLWDRASPRHLHS